MSRRPTVIGSLIALVLVASFAAAQFFRSGATPRDETLIGTTEDFPSNTVTYLQSSQMFIVNWGDGIRALDETPPDHRFENARCEVRYYRDSGGKPTSLPLDDRVALSGGGYFKSECSDSHFNWWRREDLQKTCMCGAIPLCRANRR